jgi:anthranilate phosphoribosyltransferase
VLEGGRVETRSVSPEDAGLPRGAPEALRGGDPAHNAAIARGVLAGERGPRRDVVVLNAAAALVVARRAADLREGAALAGAALEDGRALRLLQRIVELAGA